MLPFLRDHHADPGRLHAEGRVTRVAVEDAREQVAALLRRPAARGRVHRQRHRGGQHRDLRARSRTSRTGGGVVTTAVEHSCVLDACRARAERASPSSASTGSAASTPTRSPRDHAPTPRWCRCSSPTTRSARCSRRPRSCAEARDRGVLVHVDACAAAGHVAGRLRRPRRRPLLGHRPHVRRAEGRGRAAGPARAALPAVRRRRRAGTGPAGRHRERARDRRLRRRAPPTLDAGLDDEAARARAHRAPRARCARGASTGRRALRRSRRLPPPPRLPRRRGRRGRADPARARPARRRGALGLVVLERVARAVAGARGDGRRRRPLAAGQRRAGRRPTPTSTRSSTRCPVVVGSLRALRAVSPRR